jgi:cytochrome oxidase Cu insertion factor (SCO1/SenC/PrrC family)
MEAGAGIRRRPRHGSPRPSSIALVLAVALMIGAGAGLAVQLLSARKAAPPAAAVQTPYGMHGVAAWAAGAHPAPAIDTLRDQFGKVFSLASLRGKTVAIAFFDSHCHTSCPLEGRALSVAERSLPRSERPVLVAVSVNTQDTPASVAAATRKWGLSGVAPWYWLMGTRKELAAVWAKYHIYVSARPIDGDIQHTEALYLVDRRGDERSAYLWPFAPKFVTMDIRKVAARGGAGGGGRGARADGGRGDSRGGGRGGGRGGDRGGKV